MKRLLFSSWLFHSFPLVKGGGSDVMSGGQLQHCSGAAFLTANRPRPAGAAFNKNWSYSVALPHALDPPASHLPVTSQPRTAEIRLKSTLQGPKGARVLKQGGEPRDCEREGL